ncbi:MAG: hypothetical protein C0483_05315 [Pirellula sp.]|nr:hypothetical protein [Pirellula sp.]
MRADSIGSVARSRRVGRQAFSAQREIFTSEAARKEMRTARSNFAVRRSKWRKNAKRRCAE